MVNNRVYAGLLALGACGMGLTAQNAAAAAVWMGTADYTLAPGGTAANADKVGPFNEFDFASAGVVLLKPTASGYNGYYQSFVSQHLLDGVLAPSAKLNSNHELTVVASFQQSVFGPDFQVTGGSLDLYFGNVVNRNFNTDSGFTDGASILHGTIVEGSGALFKRGLTGSGYSDLTIQIDSFNHAVFDPPTIASGGSIFTLRLNSTLDSSFITPITHVQGQTYEVGNGDLKLVQDGNLILAVPEPSEWAMMLPGLIMIGFVASRRRSLH